MTHHDFTSARSTIQSVDTPTSQRDTLLKILAAIASADAEAIGELLTDDVELHIHGVSFWAGSWTGKSAVVSAILENFAKITNQKPEILAMIEQPGGIAVRLQETGQLRRQGTPYSAEGIAWYTFEGDRMKQVHEYLRES